VTPSDFQLYLPVIVIVAVIALRWHQMMRPRRLRVGALWAGPALILAGLAALLATRPAPTPAHDAGLAVAALFGGIIGWTRAKLSKVELDPANDMLTLRGTPYGLLMLVLLVALRTGIRVATIKHPEWGIDINKATDFLMFFALGIVSGYAGELFLAARRVRR
jgi:hypothetical protein